MIKLANQSNPLFLSQTPQKTFWTHDFVDVQQNQVWFQQVAAAWLLGVEEENKEVLQFILRKVVFLHLKSKNLFYLEILSFSVLHSVSCVVTFKTTATTETYWKTTEPFSTSHITLRIISAGSIPYGLAAETGSCCVAVRGHPTWKRAVFAYFVPRWAGLVQILQVFEKAKLSKWIIALLQARMSIRLLTWTRIFLFAIKY